MLGALLVVVKRIRLNNHTHTHQLAVVCRKMNYTLERNTHIFIEHIGFFGKGKMGWCNVNWNWNWKVYEKTKFISLKKFGSFTLRKSIDFNFWNQLMKAAIILRIWLFQGGILLRQSKVKKNGAKTRTKTILE